MEIANGMEILTLSTLEIPKELTLEKIFKIFKLNNLKGNVIRNFSFY